MQTQSDTDTDASGIGAAGAAIAPGAARGVMAAILTTARILLRSAEVLLWSVFFIAAIFFLALRYWVLPNVERYREDIVAAVSQAVGLAVSVDRISADWRGLRPQLELVNVRLRDAGGREALVLPSVVNVIAWRSLLFLDLRLHAFEVDDLKLSVRRDAQGRIAVGGILLDTGKKGDGRLGDWVLGQPEIVLRNAEIEWVDDLRNAPPLKLSALNFRLQNDADEHIAGFSARPPPELGTSVEVRAELIGHSVMQPGAWNGRLFAEVGNTDLAAWRAWLDYPVDVRSGEGAVRIWATLAEGKLRRFAADLSLAKVVAQLGADLPLLQLSSLQGRLSGRTTPDGFELGTRELQFKDASGAQMQPTTLRLSVDRPAAGAQMKGSFAASLLEFAPLAHVAEALPLPADVRRLLLDAAPQGSLSEVKFDWRGELPRPVAFTAHGHFSALAMRARGRIPGFSGVSGSIDANERTGTLTLAAKDVAIDLPNVFRETRTKLDALSGQVSWEDSRPDAAAAGSLQFRLAKLSFSNADLAGTASGMYTYTGQGPGVIDLSAQLSRADAGRVQRYVPRIFSAGLRAWLDSAIVAGVSNDVRLHLRGDLYDFPFIDPAKGQFQVSAKVRNGVLNYVQGWPRIEGIEVDLLFERDRAEFVARKANILGATLSRVSVGIAHLAEGVVSISGQADGPTGDFLNYIQQTPVRRMVSGFTDEMQATGRGQLRLKLDLPLADMEKSKVMGQYQFNANNVSVNARLPPIERATGRVEFTQDSLAIQDVRGALFGAQAVISGGTRPEGGVQVSARGEATVPGLRNFFDHPWKRFLSGRAPYTASVAVAKGATRIVFETPLTGVTSELPAPLAKSAEESLPLRVEILPVEGGDRINVSVGKFLTAEFQRQRQGDAMFVQRAGVGLNQASRLPDKNGWMLAGTFPVLDLDSWLPLVTAGDAGGAASANASGPAAAAPSAATFDLKLGALDAFGKRLHAVALRAGADTRGWQATLSATEMAGDLSYRTAGRGKLTARLSHFTPPGEAPGAKQRDGAGELPAVDLVAERFNYRGKQLGRIEVVALPEGANWRIEKISNLNPEAALEGKGLWVTGGRSRTSLEFNLNVNDAGKYLDRVGTPDSLKGGNAKLAGTLSWAGDPLNIDYPSLAGAVSLGAENGQFLEIEPGIGKLISLISLQMLPRRVALDFRDVFSKGFTFDNITSSLQIEKGVIHTKDFKMRGPTAEVQIDGEADLASETQNLHVRVVPALGGSASTLVGLLNPLYGVATLIAQSLLKNPLGNIFAFEYAISGRWADPKVERVGVVPVEAHAGPGESFR
ncbi:MAG: TIGR02099 family protein [Betaproteobacteria bacterium]|nr:TIGR02099 family protein [Betaproteobacteria bacterium]